jgi:hypothetical protein
MWSQVWERLRTVLVNDKCTYFLKETYDHVIIMYVSINFWTSWWISVKFATRIVQYENYLFAGISSDNGDVLRQQVTKIFRTEGGCWFNARPTNWGTTSFWSPQLISYIFQLLLSRSRVAYPHSEHVQSISVSIWKIYFSLSRWLKKAGVKYLLLYQLFCFMNTRLFHAVSVAT